MSGESVIFAVGIIGRRLSFAAAEAILPENARRGPKS